MSKFDELREMIDAIKKRKYIGNEEELPLPEPKQKEKEVEWLSEEYRDVDGSYRVLLSTKTRNAFGVEKGDRIKISTIEKDGKKYVLIENKTEKK